MSIMWLLLCVIWVLSLLTRCGLFLCVASHWPTSSWSASPSFLHQIFHSFLKKHLRSFSGVVLFNIARSPAGFADALSAFLTVVIFLQWTGVKQLVGFSVFSNHKWKPDMQNRAHFIFDANNFHSDSSPVGQRRQLMFDFYIFFYVVTT